MTYILLIAFPIVMSVSCFLLRKLTQLVIVAAVATMLVQFVLVLLLPVDVPSRLLGLTLTLTPLSRLFLAAFFVVAALAFVAAWRLPHGENFTPVALLMLGFTSATLLFVQEPFVLALLLISGSITAVLAIVDLPTGSAALVERATLATGLKYLVMIVVAGVAMYLAYVLLSIYPFDEVGADRVSPAQLVLGLLVIGFGVRLAMAPFHSWLPDIVSDAAPMVSVIVVAVVNITSLLGLVNTLYRFPVVVTENERGLLILQGFAILTAVLGAGFALVQPSIRRTLGYLLVYDSGMMLFGLTTVTSLGVMGALFHAFNQIVIVLILFLALGLLEMPDGRASHVVRRDLLRRWPIAGTGLICGVLALVGLPPFNGYASKLLIYEAAAQRGWPYLALLLFASLLALLALFRLMRDSMLGPSEDAVAEEAPLLAGATELDTPIERRRLTEPRGLAMLLSVLVAVSVIIGLYPHPVLQTIDEVIRGLAFLRAS